MTSWLDEEARAVLELLDRDDRARIVAAADQLWATIVEAKRSLPPVVSAEHAALMQARWRSVLTGAGVDV